LVGIVGYPDHFGAALDSSVHLLKRGPDPTKFFHLCPQGKFILISRGQTTVTTSTVQNLPVLIFSSNQLVFFLRLIASGVLVIGEKISQCHYGLGGKYENGNEKKRKNVRRNLGIRKQKINCKKVQKLRQKSCIGSEHRRIT
jgi:hypothetical protein